MRLSASYERRIDLVIDHVMANPATGHRVESLARVAGFSPFHFHRIFTAVAGESVGEFVSRIRVEHAAKLMAARRSLSVTDAATACGFESLPGFSRAFRRRFGMSPSRWDRRQPLRDRKISQAFVGLNRYGEDELEQLGNSRFKVRVEKWPEMRLAYVRVIGSYERPTLMLRAYEQLVEWHEKEIGDCRAATFLGMSQDDPEITPPRNCRFDWCVILPSGVDQSGTEAVSIRAFPACEVVAAHVAGDIADVDLAWQYLFRSWLPSSRWLPADLPAVELYRRAPAEIGWESFDLDCVVPVVRDRGNSSSIR